MSATVFVDTNLLVYRRDARDEVKQRRAEEWLTALWRQRTGRLSIQVLNEFYVVVTQKLAPALDREDARRTVRMYLSWRPIAVDARVLETALPVQDRHRLAWWDALIVASAHLAGCRYLLSEDFSDGRDFDGLEVINPFLRDPTAIG